MRGKCNQLGLTFGLTLAIVHAVWALAVAITPTGMQKLINWSYSLNFVKETVTVTPFDGGRAVVLVVLTFAVGYVIGCLASACYHWAGKK